MRCFPPVREAAISGLMLIFRQRETRCNYCGGEFAKDNRKLSVPSPTANLVSIRENGHTGVLCYAVQIYAWLFFVRRQEMTKNIVSALLALALGLAIAFINSRITKKALEKNTNGAMAVSLVRSFLNIACIFGVYFLAKAADCALAYPLIGAGIGLTVPSLIFAFSMSKKLSEQENAAKEQTKKEDEDK